jgi:hypothetical protein
MNLEKQLVEKFQVEELEKRYEMGHYIHNIYDGKTFYHSNDNDWPCVKNGKGWDPVKPKTEKSGW